MAAKAGDTGRKVAAVMQQQKPFSESGSSPPLYVAELTRRRYRGRVPKPVRGPDDVLALLGKRLFDESREHFVVILLNTRHEAVGVETVSIGSLNACIVHPREVFKQAVLVSAAAIICAHNHPSGDPEPSEEDLAITQRLAKVGELLGISLLDHVIVARRGTVSLRERRAL
jgi:DNA repair protein RadC